jgi:hypothetical protein
LLAAALVVMTCALSACEWSSGGNSGFNTSRAGLDVNISGNYAGALSGNRAVANTSGAPIFNLVIQQSGNALNVTDSNGQRYQGAVGAPGAIVAAGTSEIPAGAELASYQLSWSGTDFVAAKDVEFTGVIEIVAVDRVRGDSTTQTLSSSQASSSDQANPSNDSGRDTVREITTTFELTEGNSQFRLRGTWIETGGLVSPVNALSPGAGLFGVTATASGN